ncbi:MAG: transposase [Pyrinomonadaceae bacterium]
MTDYNFKPKFARDEFGWYWRNLPHFDGGELTQFVTFRLGDSVPAELIKKWRSEAKSDTEFRKRVERFLDSGFGECWLRNESIAGMIVDSLKFHHSTKYALHAWVSMPNHVHVLLTPLSGYHLAEVMHSIKSYTAQQANKILNRTGQFWQRESFDRYIRNAKHFTAAVRYIEQNPVKAKISKTPQDWPWSSACSD